ncbi:MULTISPECIES: class I adenylate-forming enzyme family protein [Microbacterium]|uniref:class I adenylate-forming enzyme family protein n=1 Tax=Microbacterium TaxID=33882 RepID=UPI00214C8B35|nr:MULTISPECIES: class I adenylate-forming enzyme family protein [unclassified Microbacterium]MCR2811547.1 acyl--CoA ligase [Microbacterium sp. zg.Y1084]MDL5487681.1 class I adenylate-forming enzyme family protein [Microbacterium sp. zg-Y1211]
MSADARGADGPHTVGRWLTDRAGASPARIAIDDRGVTITYGELEQRAAALAQRLEGAGYRAGQRIATISGNSIDHVAAFFACARSGLAFVPLSWRLAPRELAELIDRAAPALVLVDDEYAALADDAFGRLTRRPPVAALGTTGVEAAAPPPADASDAAPRPVRDDDPLLVIFTSGSEAAPKGVVLTHANCFWNNLALSGALQLTADDVVLAILPQFHVAAWNVQPLLAWWVGATVVLERSFQPGRVLQLIAERGVTAMMGVPTQYRQLADDPRFGPEGLGSLRLALVGGATMSPDTADRWADTGVTLTQGYGLTEAAPNVLCLPAGQAAAHSGAVGRPYPHVEVMLADPETGLELQGAATGELWVRGPSVFAGYLDDPAATDRARAGAWLRTGDIAARDADGVYRIVDRLKDIFISGGENVAPAEVERALGGHPAVAEVAVVGAPDPVWGERGVAFVVRAPGALLGADELLAHARRELAAYKVPARVAFVDALPRSTIDKLARTQLRAQAAALVAAPAATASVCASAPTPIPTLEGDPA